MEPQRCCRQQMPAGIVSSRAQRKALYAAVIEMFWLKKRSPRAITYSIILNQPRRYCCCRAMAYVGQEHASYFSHASMAGRTSVEYCRRARQRGTNVIQVALLLLRIERRRSSVCGVEGVRGCSLLSPIARDRLHAILVRENISHGQHREQE